MRLDLQIALPQVFFGSDLAVAVLSLTQVYLDILCHVTYILDTLQADLRRHVPEQNSEVLFRATLTRVALNRIFSTRVI